MSQSTGSPNRSAVSRSTLRTCSLVRVGGCWPLDDKGAVGIAAVDRILLRDGRTQELRDEVRGDRADLGKFQCGVPERAVVDGDADAVLGLLGRGQRGRPPDPV